MNSLSQILSENFSDCSTEAKLARIVNISKSLKIHHPGEEEYAETVQLLVNWVPIAGSSNVRKLLFKNIDEVYLQHPDLPTVKLTPILNNLDENDPAYICDTLQLLALTYDKKYIPVISRYIYFADDQVNEVAINALTYIQYRSSSIRFCADGSLFSGNFSKSA